MKRFLTLTMAALLILSMISFAAPAAAEDYIEPPRLDLPDMGTVRLYLQSEPNERTRAQFDYIERVYNGKIDYAVASWEATDLKVLTDISSGTSPDIMALTKVNFPRVAVQRLVVPLSSLDAELVNHPALTERGTQSPRAVYQYAGEQYAIAGIYSQPFVIYFNKTMFDDMDVKMPRAYYDEGEWTWDNFRQCAMDVMQYDVDGNVTVWGYESWAYDVWVLANGAKYVEYTPDGGISLTLDDPKTVRALQFMQDAYFKDQYMKPDGNITHTTDFVAGRCAMLGDMLYKVSQFTADMKDEWDFVPYPTGPDNELGLVPGGVEGWAMTSTAKNPVGALVFLIAQSEWSYANKDINLDPSNFVNKMTEEQRAMYDSYSTGELSGLVTVGLFEGIGNIQNKQWDWWFQVINGTPIATANETYRPVFMAEIEATLADVKPPVIEAFAPLPVIDFEDATADFVVDTVPGVGNWGNASFEITDDGIDGKSLKITRYHESPWQLACRTVPEKVFIPAYGHTYAISFDYRMLTDMLDENSYMYVCMRPEAEVQMGGVSFGWFTINAKKAGDAGTFTATFAIGKQAEPLCLVIGGYQNGDMLIDNITITEVVQ